ncbi:hypothetical protein [Marivita sp. XM-24bin2]|jgi:hypothetical protein|uniref:hypothetical protein n=1 Tax=unclassified Marivita TaxID=2632480 RepID=UPI000D79A503|nr:hypothetical protein [Marivita sp. XM-24bin2]MCR9109902.1 hypothetical protein [Paracoccaceae bacterium]PWL36408.1 MAG: hypothetical protein DCO97_04180 [Marivita sp. XM-24bin2]
MEHAETIKSNANTLRALMAKRLGLKRGSLTRRVSKAGRRLPSGVLRDISIVAEAEKMARNPRLAKRLDANATKSAFDRASTHLKAIDVADRRKGLALTVMGSMAFNLLAAVTLLIVVLRWRGLI